MQHIKCAILQRFIGFTKKLSTSRKKVIRNTYNLIGNDCRSTTGSNMRNIMLESGADPLKPIAKTDVAKKAFKPIPTSEEWRIELIKDLIRVRDGSMSPIGWNHVEIQDTLTYLCTT